MTFYKSLSTLLTKQEKGNQNATVQLERREWEDFSFFLCKSLRSICAFLRG
jgi:hypothetical protein